VSETWFDASKHLLGDMFDSTMNYVYRNSVLDYANGGDARASYRNLELLRENYPPQALHAAMNLLSSHDTARSLHVFGFKDGAEARRVRVQLPANAPAEFRDALNDARYRPDAQGVVEFEVPAMSGVALVYDALVALR